MRDNPIHTFFQFLGGQIPDQVALGGLGWVTVVMYWALLLATATGSRHASPSPGLWW